MKTRTKLLTRTLLILLVTYLTTQSLLPLVPNIIADGYVDQSIEVCFIGLDYEGNVLSSLPGYTSVSMNLHSVPGHLVEGQVNSYGTLEAHISSTNDNGANSKLTTDNGLIDANCSTYTFLNPVNQEYTYSEVTIESDKDWLPVRYNDENTIDFVDPDIAFPYSGEWFDEVAGNENLRNTEADGHITMNPDRLHRRLVIVAQLDKNLPDYGVVFTDSVPGSLEYTLSTIPTILEPNSSIDLRFTVQNTGKLTWLSGETPDITNPVNVSYHWKDIDTGEYYLYEGNRALLNHDVAHTFNDSNIALTVNTPNTQGNYQLILDLVHEGVTWFSQADADTKTFSIQINEPQTEQVTNSRVLGTSEITAFSMAAAQAGPVIYTVQSGRPWDPSWRCAGYECYSGIAEEYYQCSARGIPNYSYGTDENALKGMCWWPIYNANRHLPVHPSYASHPWDFVEVGWQIVIPPFGINPPPPPPPVPTTGNFNGLPGSSTTDPYGGRNGSNSPWPQITFDRFIAWDGSQKFDQIKWSETSPLTAPTVTGIATNDTGTAVTIYGIAIPKYHPIHVRVWNEYRYCWACGSGWDFHYQQGTAQHVKVVLFKEGWQYLGEVWNDRSDGRWNITLPLGTNLKSGDRVFAEVQIEADYTFNNLRWWSDTYETVNFNIGNPKYFGYPYWGSGGSNKLVVPSILIDPRSDAEKAIDFLAGALRSTGASGLTNICGFPAKTYSSFFNNQPGAIVYINNRPVYSFGGTWDTFMWYGDRCNRFGVPINNPYNGGVGPYNTSGAYQDFSRAAGQATGRIYWSYKYLGKFVYGTIANKFESQGGTNSHYGWPKDEVHPVTRNGRTLNCQNFEGGEICDGEFTPYTDAQKAFSSLLGREVLIPEISAICGDKEKISIGGGIAYYDKRDGRAKRITGDIYAAWNENCSYGFPENDTSSVSGFGGTSGYAQRFNSNQPWVFDFYQKDRSGVVILEGSVKNKYDSKGGLSRLGFPHQSFDQPRTAAGRCGSSGSFWEVDNGRIYLHENSYHVVYRDTPIGSHFYANGADTKFGMPNNDESTQGTYSWQDFVVTRLELWWPGGVNESSSTEYCPGEEPVPEEPQCTPPEIWDEASKSCKVPTQNCSENEVWNGTGCIDKKEYECNQKGLQKYVNPNSPEDVTCAKVITAPYLNQWLDLSGEKGNPVDGWMHCSAASAVMALGAFGKIMKTDFSNIKEYVYLDKPFSNDGINLDEDLKSCPHLEGAFSYTAIEQACNEGIWWRIASFLAQFDIKTSEYSTRNSDRKLFYSNLKSSTDKGGLTIQGVQKGSIQHIVLLRGYTDDNLDGIADRMIVNDSYRNLTAEGDEYNMKGYGAIYDFNSNGIVFNSYYNLSL